MLNFEDEYSRCRLVVLFLLLHVYPYFGMHIFIFFHRSITKHKCYPGNIIPITIILNIISPTHTCVYGYNCISCHVTVVLTISHKILLFLEPNIFKGSSVNSNFVQYETEANIIGNDLFIFNRLKCGHSVSINYTICTPTHNGHATAYMAPLPV